MMEGRTITLGELIDALSKVGDNSDVFFDFIDFIPDKLGSWRGIYAELALGFRRREEFEDTRKVGNLLEELKAAIGATFHGYKGGEFTMNHDTPVWVDNWSEMTHTAISGIEVVDRDVIIRTFRAEWM